MGLFDDEMKVWFDQMHALASVAVVFGGLPVRGVQDESTAVDMLMPGGIQGNVDGTLITLKSEYFGDLPKSKDRITIDGKETRVLQVHTEPADPTLRITYGKL